MYRAKIAKFIQKIQYNISKIDKLYLYAYHRASIPHRTRHDEVSTKRKTDENLQYLAEFAKFARF